MMPLGRPPRVGGPSSSILSTNTHSPTHSQVMDDINEHTEKMRQV